MDGLFGKLGLYDFWGVFIAGLISLSAAVLVGSSSLLFDVVPKDHQLVAFLIESYFWGLVLRELSAFADSICFHRQKKARQAFLNDLKNNVSVKRHEKGPAQKQVHGNSIEISCQRGAGT